MSKVASSYKKALDLCSHRLLETEMTFNYMYKGRVMFQGVFEGKDVGCGFYETCTGDYYFDAKERLLSLLDADTVQVVFDGEVIIDIK